MEELNKEKNTKEVSANELRRKTIKGLLGLGIGTAAMFAGIKWIDYAEENNHVPWPLRKQLEANGRLAKKYFSNNHLAPTYSKSEAAPVPRVNGTLGLESEFNKEDWQLKIQNHLLNQNLNLTMNDIMDLPKTEIVFEFKCIEGWSEISYWGGVKFSDFLQHKKVQNILSSKNTDESIPQFVGLETPDKEYYVGLDMESAMHPQTILCYEMNGRPLEEKHGAPLRLLVPVKYGIKSIKRIGNIFFTNDRPRDYWAERGYDYHSGL